MSSLKLTSFTPLNSDTKKKVITIWKTINDSNDSLEFRNPVDWKGSSFLIQQWDSWITSNTFKNPWTSIPSTENSDKKSTELSKMSSMTSS